MIIAIKESKLDKVNPALFKILSVSTSEEIPEGSWNMDIFLPYAKLLLDRKNGNIGKKKFIKKYKKYLDSENSTIENTLFSIGLSIKSKNNLCFTCTDEEFKLGYLEALVEFICEKFEVEMDDAKDAKEKINDTIEDLGLSKKEKKLIKGDINDDELSNKKADLREKLIKRINKSIRSTMGYEGEEYFKTLDNKYAVDQIAMKLISNGAAKLTKNGEFKDINVENIGKTGPMVQAILTTYDSDKKLKKIIKEICESHDLKVKEKSLKKLDKASIVGLIGEIYTKLTIYRSEFATDED